MSRDIFKTCQAEILQHKVNSFSLINIIVAKLYGLWLLWTQAGSGKLDQSVAPVLRAWNLLPFLQNATITCPRMILWGSGFLMEQCLHFCMFMGLCPHPWAHLAHFLTSLDGPHWRCFDMMVAAHWRNKLVYKCLITSEDKNAVSWVWS